MDSELQVPLCSEAVNAPGTDAQRPSALSYATSLLAPALCFQKTPLLLKLI